MSDIVTFGVGFALISYVVLMAASSYRVFRGPDAADRLQAIETLNTVFIGTIVVLGLVQDFPSFIDMGIALAAFGFVATLAIARYLSEGRVL